MDLKNAQTILAGKPEEKRPLKRLQHRLEVNMKMDLTEI
jgi:hypothetical protein